MCHTHNQYASAQVIWYNPRFQVYYKERTTKTKSNIDTTLEQCSNYNI